MVKVVSQPRWCHSPDCITGEKDICTDTDINTDTDTDTDTETDTDTDTYTETETSGGPSGGGPRGRIQGAGTRGQRET